MREKLIALYALFAMSAGIAIAENSNASLTLKNDSTKDPGDASVYTWANGTSEDGNWSLLDGTVVLTYAADNQKLYYNRDSARDLTGSTGKIILGEGATNSYLYVGYAGATSNANALGFYNNPTITGVSRDASTLTISNAPSFNVSHVRNSGDNMITVSNATVRFTDLNFFTSNKRVNGTTTTDPYISTLTMRLNGSSALYWNPTIMEGTVSGVVTRWADLSPQFYSGVKFDTTDNTSANVTIGTAPAVTATESAYNYRNMSFDGYSSSTRMNVAFSDQSKQINISNYSGMRVVNASFSGTSSERLNLALSTDSGYIVVSGVLLNYTNLAINSAASAFNITTVGNTRITLNADVASTADLVFHTGDSLALADGVLFSTSGRISLSGANGLTLGDGATLSTAAKSNAQTSANNITNNVTLGTGATLEFAGAFRSTGTNNIDGNLIINGAGARDRKNVDSFIFGNTGTFTFGENATLSQHLAEGTNRTRSDSSLVQNWTGINNVKMADTKIISNAGIGALDFGNKLNILKGTEITLNSSNAFIIGSDESWAATDQASSVFTLANAASVGLVDGTGITTFVINAANDIGSFSFEDSSDANYILKLVFGVSGSLTVGEDASLTSFALDGGTQYQVQLEDAILTNKLRVFDLTKEEIEANFVVSDTENYFVQAVDAGSGSYWVNVVAVPEPAAAAFVFGALALGFAAYRRRK